MKTHLKIIAVLLLFQSTLVLFPGFILFYTSFDGAIFSLIKDKLPYTNNILSIIQMWSGIIGALVLAYGYLSLISGLGILKHRNWARICGIIIMILNILNFPFGTIIAIYGLWILLSVKSVVLFRSHIYSKLHNTIKARFPVTLKLFAYSFVYLIFISILGIGTLKIFHNKLSSLDLDLFNNFAVNLKINDSEMQNIIKQKPDQSMNNYMEKLKNIIQDGADGASLSELMDQFMESSEDNNISINSQPLESVYKNPNFLGKKAPRFNGINYNGETISIEQFKNSKIVWIIFASPKCDNSHSFTHKLSSLEKEYDQTTVFITVLKTPFKNRLTSPEELVKWAVQYDLAKEYIVYDSTNTDSYYNPLESPHHVIIDKSGIIRHMASGSLSDRQINIILDSLL